MRRLTRLYHTARHLRPAQLLARAWPYSAQRAPPHSPQPPLRAPRAPFMPPPRPAASVTGARELRLLNETHLLEDAGSWSDSRRTRLWLYNLHYFDDLAAADAAARRPWHEELIERWIRDNPPVAGCGWEPYPLSRRIVNWVKFALEGGALTERARDSLAVQARQLARRLEWHLGGNHLLANAVALIHAGAYFAGAEAEGWLGRGRALLERELAEQLLPDGAHYERSPMYQAIVLKDLLDVRNVLLCYALQEPAGLAAGATRMCGWLACLSHPDGEIAFFNDAAVGVAPEPRELFACAERLGLPRTAPAQGSRLLEPSGFARLARGPAVLLADCGGVGPDHLPGHAHAGTLSFELSLDGQRLLVNSGTSLYEPGPARESERSTAAHNTLVVDGQNSSDVWHAFRVGERARVRDARLRAGALEDELSASHDGYLRLGSGVVHARRWRLQAAELLVEDHVSGRPQRAEAYFHLHPQVSVAQVDAAAARVRALAPDGRTLNFAFAGARELECLEGDWHPQFGVTRPNRVLRVLLADGELTTHLEWGLP